MPQPGFSGKNARLVFVMDRKKVEFIPKTWNVKQRATLIADGVGGEDRDRIGKIIDGYDWALACYQTTLNQLMALLGYDAKLDTNTEPFECGAGIVIYPNNGTRAGFEGREISIDDWTFDGNPGRTERSMLVVPFRTRYFEPVPTI